MLEVGTKFDYCWSSDDDDDAEYDETVIVQGYTYYEGTLYYVCMGPSEVSVDVYHVSAHNRAAKYEN